MAHLPVIDSRMARPASVPRAPDGFGEPTLPPLVDKMGRVTTYLRLSLTDRCNMACTYCMPPGGEHEHAMRPELLTFEEATRLLRVFAAGGVRRVRLTGGEPLVRKDIVRLVEMVKRDTPIDELVMTTNASRLPELARPLRDGGLDAVNVSIDSLDADRFRAITRGGDLASVLAGIHAALDVGLEVKINAVALGGVNDDEIGDLVEWAWGLGITPRFIELMPIGEAARLPKTQFLSADTIRRRLGSLLVSDGARSDAGKGPARYLLAADGSGRRVGFITAVSDDFCADCNRVRVTAQGDVRACLADRRAVSLRDAMRAGADDRELAWSIHWAMATKDASHHFNDASADEHENVGMSLIGG
ncbi:MAG: GTP 3',8-cyclase MoaA [Sandaracinaceae bacterium]